MKVDVISRLIKLADRLDQLGLYEIANRLDRFAIQRLKKFFEEAWGEIENHPALEKSFLQLASDEIMFYFVQPELPAWQAKTCVSGPASADNKMPATMLLKEIAGSLHDSLGSSFKKFTSVPDVLIWRLGVRVNRFNPESVLLSELVGATSKNEKGQFIIDQQLIVRVMTWLKNGELPNFSLEERDKIINEGFAQLNKLDHIRGFDRQVLNEAVKKLEQLLKIADPSIYGNKIVSEFSKIEPYFPRLDSQVVKELEELVEKFLT